MDYKDSLKSLREQLFTEPEKENKKKTGFIPVRLPVKDSNAKVEVQRSLEWLKEIKTASEEIRNSYKYKEPEVPGFSENQINTVQQTIQTPEEKKENFIARRGDLPSSYAPRPSNVRTFEEAINATESGGSYDTLFGHSQRDGGAFAGVKVSEMTIGELINFAGGEYGKWAKKKLGYTATPMGKYQFVGTTMKKVAQDMGLSSDTVFTPEVQDRMFHYQLSRRINSGSTMASKIKNIRSEWEGFKSIPDTVLANLISEYEGT